MILGYKNRKLYLLQKSLKEKGLYFTFKEKIIPYLLRPIWRMVKKNRFLVGIFYGSFPDFQKKLPFLRVDSRMIRSPKNRLVEKVRRFWYSNIPGTFNLDGEFVTRKDISLYGGPNPYFVCPICQKSEWLSRIRQKNLFSPHSCKDSEKCAALCSYQGNELWTHFHQNFGFSIGCDPNLPAPRCLYVTFDKNEDMFTPRPAYRDLVFRRQIARTCQVDVVYEPVNIDWGNYDFIYVFHTPSIRRFPRPNLPVILYAHDFWPIEDRGFQWGIDWLKPDVLLTSYPTQWKENFKISDQTKVVFSPLFESSFFTRPNLTDKRLDLIVSGATSSSIYSPRKKLSEQISKLAPQYKIEFSHAAGHLSLDWKGETFKEDLKGGPPVRYLNKWSEYLGSAKYVTFGKMKWPILIGKYYEVLGSGAIPIFPEVPDLKYLGIKPFEHYIPLSEIEGKNEKLTYFLDHYEDFRYIAKNAVDWYRNISDKMLFGDFEDLIREATGYRFPKRLV